MKKIELSAFDLAQRFIGISEVAGPTANPQVLAMLRLDDTSPGDDQVPWCSAFVNYVAWLLRLPRSRSLRARSWLSVGQSVTLDEAEVGFDVVILKQESRNQPGPDVLDAGGHVGFFAGREGEKILVFGGNQSDKVTLSRYSSNRLLGIRRLRM